MITLLNVTLFNPDQAPTDRLVWLAPTAGSSRRFQNLSYPEYRDYRGVGGVFSGVVAFSRVKIALGGDTPERVQGLIVSGNYFDVLGIRAAHGRTFLPHEDAQPDAHPVVVIGDGLWKRRFGSDPQILDSPIIVNGQPFTVVGVAPPGFAGIELDDEPAAVWVPLAMARTVVPESPDILSDQGAGWLQAVARLAPGVSIAQAKAAAGPIASRRQPSPDAMPRDLTILPVAGGFDPSNRSELVPVFALLALVPLLVLTVACANAANLLLARAVPRRRELAVRAALGASRFRLVRQLLIESTLLSLAAGGAGLLLSFWMIDVIGGIGQIPEGFASALTPDGRVLAATTLLAAVTGMVFGLAPAIVATRTALVPALKDQGVTVHLAGRRHRLRDGLVVSQVAISLVLLVTAGIFLRSLGKALAVDPGFEPRGVIAMSVDPGLQGYRAAARAAFEDRVIEAVRGIPSVRAAAIISDVPLSGRMIGDEVAPEGSTAREGIRVHYAGISPGYFTTMGVPLVRGRDFAASDAPGSVPVVIVNETLARRLWPDADPIGKRLGLTGRAPLREVVGIAGDGKYDSLTDGRQPFLYFPDHQFQVSSQFSLVARVKGDPGLAVRSLTAAVHQLDANLPVFAVASLTSLVKRTSTNNAQPRRCSGPLDRWRCCSRGSACSGS